MVDAYLKPVVDHDEQPCKWERPDLHGLGAEEDDQGLALCRIPSGILSHGPMRPSDGAAAAHAGAWGVESARVLPVTQPPDSATHPSPAPLGPLVVVCRPVALPTYPKP